MSAPATPSPRLTDLTDLTPEQITAPPPEQQEEWKRQDRREADDFHFLQRFVLDLYPSVRRYFKRSRAEDYFNDFSKPSDGPLYDAFEMLLTFADDQRRDPEFAERMWFRVARYKADRERRKAGRESGMAQAPEAAPTGGDARPEQGEGCPDCGSALDRDSARCPVCRRFIG